MILEKIVLQIKNFEMLVFKIPPISRKTHTISVTSYFDSKASVEKVIIFQIAFAFTIYYATQKRALIKLR